MEGWKPAVQPDSRGFVVEHYDPTQQPPRLIGRWVGTDGWYCRACYEWDQQRGSWHAAGNVDRWPRDQRATARALRGHGAA